jgi:hypothetical protein
MMLFTRLVVLFTLLVLSLWTLASNACHLVGPKQTPQEIKDRFNGPHQHELPYTADGALSGVYQDTVDNPNPAPISIPFYFNYQGASGTTRVLLWTTFTDADYVWVKFDTKDRGIIYLFSYGITKGCDVEGLPVPLGINKVSFITGKNP